MRPLEVLVLASLVLSGVALFVAPERRPALLRYRPFVPLTLAVIHVFIDHGRWQLFPAYALAGVMAVLGVWGLRRTPDQPPLPPTPGWRRRLAGLAVLLVTAASGIAATLVPLFTLPEPTGPHRVGTRWLILPDSARDEDLSPDAGEKRTLVVRLWYPADSVAGKPEPYIEREVAVAIARALGLPGFFLSHLTNVDTHAYRRAWIPAAPERLPLIVFSHGYGAGTESQNTVQMEELASHGFVVASIDHPYEAAAIVMRDGEVVAARPRFAPRDSGTMARSVELVRRLQSARDTTAVAALLPDLYDLSAPLELSIAQWTQDTRFVLDALARMSTPGATADTVLTGRLDTDRVGMMGMSFGGATAANVCLRDARCAAGINLDGLLYGDAARAPLARPFVVASAEESRQLHRLFHQRAIAPNWLLTVRDARHLDFSDLNWFAPALGRRLGMLGGIAPARMHRLLNAVVVPWFDAALRRGAALDSAALASAFPEVTIERRLTTAAADPDTSSAAGNTPATIGAPPAAPPAVPSGAAPGAAPAAPVPPGARSR